MQQRPTGVPKQAVYAKHEGWWQIGEIRNGMPFGPWRTFRADGSPLFEARFDSKGRLQGAYKRFHPDGSLAREATYSAGKPTGEHVYHRARGAAGDVFPCADPRVHRIVIGHDGNGREASRAWLDERGREIGEALDERAGGLDGELATAQPDGFLASGGFARVVGALDRAEPAAADDFLLPLAAGPRRAMTPARFQDVLGRPMPAELRAWCEAMAQKPKLLGVHAIDDAELVADGNLAEALIAEYQRAPGRTTGLRELAAGVFPIAQTADGNERYVVATCEVSSGSAPSDAVYAMSIAGDEMTPPDARTLDDFAYAVALASAASTGAVSRGALRTAYEKLRGRVDLRRPLRDIEQRALGEDEDDEVVGDEAGDHRKGFHFQRAQPLPPYFLYRTRWLLRLLRGYAEAAAAAFEPPYDGGLSDERFERIRTTAPKEPFVALYWLFRSLAFQDPRLDTLLRICSDSPASLVRDIAALVGELAAGRTQLGDVGDFQDVLRRFRALDPLANKAEGEQQESDEEEAPPARERPPVPPELADAVAVIDWAAGEGFSRENLRLDHERDAAGLGLARRADPRVLPFLVQLADEHSWIGAPMIEPWLDADRADLAELVPAARRWLETTHDAELWRVAAMILARAGTAEDAERIAKPLEEALDALWAPKQGFGHAMAMMTLGEALPPMCEAAGKLGITDSLAAALEGLVQADTHVVDDERGPCALALAAAGRGLDAIVAGVRGQIAKEHADRITGGQLLALGRLGKHGDRREELAQLVESLTELEHEPALARAIALADLGRPIDVAAAVQQLLEEERYGDDDTAKQRAFALGFVATRDDVPAELALPHVLDHQLITHRAAVRALRARGREVPAFTLYDPLHVAELAARGRDAVHAALADERGLYRQNLALWLAEHPDESSRDPLARAARLLAAEPDFPDDGPYHYELRWIVRALIATGGAEDVLVELLRHDSENVAEPCMRYTDELTPGVARGIVHVFVHHEHWKESTAKEWLAQHKHEAAVQAALAEHGLTVEDISRTEADDEDEDDEDEEDDE